MLTDSVQSLKERVDKILDEIARTTQTSPLMSHKSTLVNLDSEQVTALMAENENLRTRYAELEEKHRQDTAREIRRVKLLDQQRKAKWEAQRLVEIKAEIFMETQRMLDLHKSELAAADVRYEERVKSLHGEFELKVNEQRKESEIYHKRELDKAIMDERAILAKFKQECLADNTLLKQQYERDMGEKLSSLAMEIQTSERAKFDTMHRELVGELETKLATKEKLFRNQISEETRAYVENIVSLLASENQSLLRSSKVELERLYAKKLDCAHKERDESLYQLKLASKECEYTSERLQIVNATAQKLELQLTETRNTIDNLQRSILHDKENLNIASDEIESKIKQAFLRGIG